MPRYVPFWDVTAICAALLKEEFKVNKNQITLGSLFDGIGGFPYAASFFGIKTIWASEIMETSVSVTKRHMPNMEHVGDITKLDGSKLAPVDIITFGSPCQGLSTAGKRGGLDDPRSGLFMEAIRIIKEMREATDGKYPRYALWENVPGAFSSNGGLDFKAVLESFTEAEVPFPKYGKWANAGMVRGNGIDIAWCVYNAQYFGVAQRRRRIFLVRDFGGESAGEILFIPKSLCRYYEAGGTPRQIIATDACGSIDGEGKINCINNQEISEDIGSHKVLLPKPKIMKEDHLGMAIPINTQIATRHISLGENTGFGVDENGNPAYALQESHSHAIAVGIHQNQRGEVSTSDIAYCVTPINTAYCLESKGCDAVGVHQSQDGTITTANTAYCLTTNSGASSRNAPLVAHVHPKVTGTLCASASGLSRPGGMGGETDLCVVTPKDKNIYCLGDDHSNAAIMKNLSPTMTLSYGPLLCAESNNFTDVQNTAYSLQGNMIGRQDKNGPLGSGINEETSFTLSATDRHAVAMPNQHMFKMQTYDGYAETDIASTQTARQYKSPTDLIAEENIRANLYNGCDADIKYTVRRLTPTECERLQGYPDGWTEFDENGKAISDTKRYQMLGNSVAVPCVAYIILGIAEQLQLEDS